MSATGPARASANSAPRRPRPRPPQVCPAPEYVPRSRRPSQTPSQVLTPGGSWLHPASSSPTQPEFAARSRGPAPDAISFTWLQAPPLNAAGSALLRLSLRLYRPCLYHVTVTGREKVRTVPLETSDDHERRSDHL